MSNITFFLLNTPTQTDANLKKNRVAGIGQACIYLMQAEI